MKKSIILISSLLITVSSAFAEWNVISASGFFYFPNGDRVNEALNFAMIVDTGNNGFEDFKLVDGDTFTANTFINSDSVYKTLTVGKFSDPDGVGEYMAYSDSSWKFDNTNFGFNGGEEVAIIVWASANPTSVGADDNRVVSGDMFCVFTPSFVNGELSGGNPWRIPTTNGGTWEWNMITISGGGILSESVGALDNTVIPESSTYTAIFSAVVLGFAAYRRRK